MHAVSDGARLRYASVLVGDQARDDDRIRFSLPVMPQLVEWYSQSARRTSFHICATQGDAMTNATRILVSLFLVVVRSVAPPQASAQRVDPEGYVNAGSGVQLFYRL